MPAATKPAPAGRQARYKRRGSVQNGPKKKAEASPVRYKLPEAAQPDYWRVAGV